MNIETQDEDNNIIQNIEKQFDEIDNKSAWAVFYQVSNKAMYEEGKIINKKKKASLASKFKDILRITNSFEMF